MYRRYGNWPDAIAAYNWGPGNVDAWIGGGRAADKFPLEVERYRYRVLREAALAGPHIATASAGWPLGVAPPRTPANTAPTAAATAFAIDALQRGAAAGDAAIREFATALRSRAANWKTAYSALAGRIASLAEKRPPPAADFEPEYAVSAKTAD